ncbi:hypothetical protein BST61_g1496 [Cercospora zeina]
MQHDCREQEDGNVCGKCVLLPLGITAPLVSIGLSQRYIRSISKLCSLEKRPMSTIGTAWHDHLGRRQASLCHIVYAASPNTIAMALLLRSRNDLIGHNYASFESFVFHDADLPYESRV